MEGGRRRGSEDIPPLQKEIKLVMIWYGYDGTLFRCCILGQGTQMLHLTVNDHLVGLGNEMNRALGHLCAHIG